MNKKILFFTLAIFVFVIDQVSKHLVLNFLPVSFKLEIIQGIVSFVKTFNTGAAFSLFTGNTHILSIFSAFVCIAVIVYFLKKAQASSNWIIFSWALILGGTAGNFYDRVVLGYVVDFIYLDFISFPVFNIADSAINIGAFVLLVYTIFADGKISEEVPVDERA